jgi:hypothetical protein
MKHRGAAVALAAALVAGAPEASAQDTHYWAIQYGPVGQLVGGQLIGGVSDLSATYYNPGALALENESSYLLSTESVQWESVDTDSSAGIQVLDTSSSRFGAAPSLIAGVLPRWFGQRTRLAWSFLTRQQFDVRLGQRLTDPLGPGVRSAAESYFDQDASEDWGGLTFSRQVSESVGVGVTWYGVYRGQRARKELSLQSVAPDGSSLAASGVSDFEYSHYRTLAKLGFAWRNRDWKAGLSITTPSLAVFGSGKAAYTLSLSGTKDRDGRPDPPVLVTDTQENLDSQYRSSWAVGAGLSRRFGGTTLYASAEWYAAVSRFTVIEVPASAPEASGLTQALASAQRRDRNRALAVRRRLGVRRFPHGLLGRHGQSGGERHHLRLGHLPRERRSRLPLPRQPLHARGVLGARPQAASARFADTAGRAARDRDRPGRGDPLLEGDHPVRLRFRELSRPRSPARGLKQ